MNLDKIQEMWERDAVINPDNLHDESLKIPQLHSKYYTVYNTVTLMREKAREQYTKIRLERHNYYTGKAPAEVYINFCWCLTSIVVMSFQSNLGILLPCLLSH